jgi:FtsH-binding integral membrane protein
VFRLRLPHRHERGHPAIRGARQRLRRSQDLRTAPLLAASIFLDILNVFLLLLSLFNGTRD